MTRQMEGQHGSVLAGASCCAEQTAEELRDEGTTSTAAVDDESNGCNVRLSIG